MAEKNRMLHVALAEGEVGEYVFLPGSPERAEKIAKHFDDYEKLAQNREHTTYSGHLEGVKVTVTSTGMGGPSTAITVEELAKLGARTFMRVGTCASTSEKVKMGDVVIANGAVKMEGTSSHYIPVEYPAIPDYFVLKELEAAAKKLGYTYNIGTTISKDSFFTQTEPETKPVDYDIINRWKAYERSGATSTEMEAATLFSVVTTLKDSRAGAVMVSATDYNDYSNDPDNRPKDLEERAIRTGIEAMRNIIKNDKKAK